MFLTHKYAWLLLNWLTFAVKPDQVYLQGQNFLKVFLDWMSSCFLYCDIESTKTTSTHQNSKTQRKKHVKSANH